MTLGIKKHMNKNVKYWLFEGTFHGNKDFYGLSYENV